MKPRIPSQHPAKKRIVLIAHDHLKPLMVEWASQHLRDLKKHQLFATGTTGKRLRDELGLEVHCFKSGPLGGDQQIGARIVDGEMDMVIFFWDPLEAQPHDVDVKALLRAAVLYNIPLACNRTSADFLLSSPMMKRAFRAPADPRVG
jgi:methylglyoxal synthase